MSKKLTQPEEIDYLLKEMAGNGLKLDAPDAGIVYRRGSTHADWHGDYVSPYRAAYMKSNGHPAHSDPSREKVIAHK